MCIRSRLVALVAGLALGPALGCAETPSQQPTGGNSESRTATSVPTSSSAPTSSSSAKPPPEPDAGEAATVLVAAGEFIRGSVQGEGDDDERPQRRITLKAFRIDRTEITVEQYGKCVQAKACTAPEAVSKQQCNWGREGAAEHPVNCVTYKEAASYCSWVGARLPTEAEWEKAARGSDGRKYPWGNEALSCERAVHPEPLEPAGRGCGKDSTWPVGSKPAGASPYGALDMSGNVWEWVADYYGERYYAGAPAEDPKGPTAGAHRAIRGGGWEIHDLGHLRAANRFRFAPTFRFHGVGFRCAHTVRP